MSEENSGGQPPTPAVIPAAAPAPASSLNPESAATDRASKANSPQAIRSLLSDLRKAPAIKPAEVKPAEATPAPAAPPAEAPAAETPAADAPPAEDTPAPDADPAADPTASDETDDDGEGGGSPITPITGKRAHLRLPPESDKVGRLALSILKRNQDLTLEEATARAKGQLGIKTDAAPAPDAAAAPKSDLPTTIEAVDAELERIDAEREKALTELRFEEVAKLDRSMRKLDRHRLQIERDTERQSSVQAREYHAAFDAAQSKSAELYEFASNPDSAGTKRMLEIDAALQENNDPLYNSPDKPLRIAQMVAAELRIAPRKKGQAAPVKPAAPAPAAPAPKRQVLPGGGSSTIPPVSTPTTAVAEQVAGIKTAHQLRQFLKPLIKR